MTNLNKEYGIPKNSAIRVEDSEDFVHIKHGDEIKLTYSKAVMPAEIKRGIEEILSENEMLAIVQKDNTGLFTWYREKFETAPNAEVVMIYRGNLKDIAKKAKEFEGVNKDKFITPLNKTQISELSK